jgi:predicted aspartyl protease
VAVNIGLLASSTGLGAGLVLLLAGLEGCSITTSDQDMLRAGLRAAAIECASGKALKVDRVDDDGRVHGTFLQGGQQDVPAFNACYNQKVKERLGGAGRATSPVQIVQSPLPTEPSAVQPSPRVTSVPIRMANGKFLVSVVLNDTQTATFLLDTGANATVISLNLARTLRLERPLGEPKAKVRMASGQEIEMSVVQVKSIAVGLARMENFGVVVHDLAGVAGSAGPAMTIDGLLGVDFLGRFTMTVNPKAGTLTLQLDDLPVK